MQRKKYKQNWLEKGSFSLIKPFSSNLFAFSIIVSLHRGRLCQAQSIQQLMKMLKIKIPNMHFKNCDAEIQIIFFFCLWKGAKNRKPLSP